MREKTIQSDTPFHPGLLAPALPYVAIIAGVYLLNSAWAAITLYHLGIIVVLSITGSWGLGQLPHSTADYLWLVVVVAGSCLGGLIVYFLWELIKPASLQLGSELAGLALTGIPWLLFMGYYFTVNPVLEELFWRGYLGQKSSGLTWNDVWFSGYHILVTVNFARWPWVVASFLVLAGAGWFWRQLARQTPGLLLPILSHAAADASIILAVFLLAR